MVSLSFNFLSFPCLVAVKMKEVEFSILGFNPFGSKEKKMKESKFQIRK